MTSIHQVHKPRSLKNRVVQAGRWVLIGHFASLMVRLLGTVVLSRIFAPETFGILSIVNTFVVVLSLFTDIGIRQAVISSPNGGSRIFLNTAWTIQILRGFLIWTLCVGLALSVYGAARIGLVDAASVYASPDLPAYIVVASLAAVIFGFQSMKSATASRDLNLELITLIELASQSASLVLVGVLGLLTRSTWAYIVGGLSYWLILVVLGHVLLRGERDKIAWDRPAVSELRNFGRWVFLSSSLGTLAASADKLLLGLWVSPSLLGCYSIAANLAFVPEAMANKMFGSVALPALSELRRSGSQRYSVSYSRLRLITNLSLTFASGVIFGCAAAVVELLYDPRYAPAGSILQWLALGLIFFAQFGLTQSNYLSLGKPRYVTAMNVAKLLSLATFVPVLFYAFGLSGAVAGVAFHLLPAVLLGVYFDHQHKLLERRIVVALAAWPAGWGVGFAISSILGMIRSAL